MRTPRRSTFMWILVFALVVIAGSVMHYALPRHDLVRIVGVVERMENFGWNRFFYAARPSGEGTGTTRDVRYIETMRPGERVLVFRNEDTGWGWPPYLKFDAADLHARARDMIPTDGSSDWVVVKSYGARNAILSIYPNILRVTPVSGPEVRIVPVTRIVFFLLLSAAGLALWLRLHRARDAGGLLHVPAPSPAGDTAPVPARGRVGRLWHRMTRP